MNSTQVISVPSHEYTLTYKILFTFYQEICELDFMQVHQKLPNSFHKTTDSLLTELTKYHLVARVKLCGLSDLITQFS